MKNWKTTLASVITAIAGFVQFSPMLFQRWPWVIDLSKYIMAGGIIGMGLSAKDASTHSTVAEVEVATVKQQDKTSNG